MSYPTVQFTPVLNTSQTIRPPDVKEKDLTFVLYNQSPFILLLSIGPISTFMPAFTADAFPVGGFAQVITFTPISGSSTNPPLNRVFGVFYLPGEALPFGAFPASLSGGPSPDDIAVSVANQAFATLAQTLLNTGARIIDQPFVAARTTMTSGVEMTPFLNVAASGFQSYQIMLQFSNGAQSATNFASVEIRFKDDQNNVVWRDLVEINAGNVETYITDRMHGTVMTLFPTFPGGTLSVDWLFSNRPADRLHIQEQACNDRILLNRVGTTVAASATSGHQFVPLFHGPIQISLDADAGVSARWDFYFGSLSGVVHKFSFTGVVVILDINILPIRPLHYTITNGVAAQHTFFTSIWARDN